VIAVMRKLQRSRYGNMLAPTDLECGDSSPLSISIDEDPRNT
jgi:hypothetical protein